MGTKVAVVGAGAIGGYAGARMALAGEDVTLIDAWPEHVESIRCQGIHLTGSAPVEDRKVPVRALHVSDVQNLHRERPFDAVFVSTKSYDTEFAVRLIRDYLAPDGFVVSLQNCINEATIARIVGWSKTLGVIVATLGAELQAAGRVMRTAPLTGSSYVNFRVGEVHGRTTPRAQEVARLLALVDSSKVTSNLWGERWSKLCVNAMRNGLSAATGLGGNARDLNEATRLLGIRLGSEAVRVGWALGFQLEKIARIPPEVLALAGDGEKAALAEATGVLLEEATKRSDVQRPSMAQDMAKGRRTETDAINGFVALKGDEVGVPAPTHAQLNEIVKRVEKGTIDPGIQAVASLIDSVRDSMGMATAAVGS